MFEYHGWITLRSTAETVDDEPPLRLHEIQALVNDLAGYALMDLRPMNGGYYIHVGGLPNHRGTWGPALIDLFAKVGHLAPGSYGLLYVHDDEDPEHALNFRVFRLVRGAHQLNARLAACACKPLALGRRSARGDCCRRLDKRARRLREGVG